MREQILIGTIAMVGLVGLLSIHRDVKLTKKSRDVPYHPNVQAPTTQVLAAATNYEPAMEINHQQDEASIVITIHNFNTRDQFLLDLGNGERKPLKEAQQQISYSQSGSYLLKLFKNEELLEASELLITNEIP